MSEVQQLVRVTTARRGLPHARPYCWPSFRIHLTPHARRHDLAAFRGNQKSCARQLDLQKERKATQKSARDGAAAPATAFDDAPFSLADALDFLPHSHGASSEAATFRDSDLDALLEYLAPKAEPPSRHPTTPPSTTCPCAGH